MYEDYEKIPKDKRAKRNNTFEKLTGPYSVFSIFIVVSAIQPFDDHFFT